MHLFYHVDDLYQMLKDFHWVTAFFNLVLYEVYITRICSLSRPQYVFETVAPSVHSPHSKSQMNSLLLKKGSIA